MNEGEESLAAFVTSVTLHSSRVTQKALELIPTPLLNEATENSKPKEKNNLEYVITEVMARLCSWRM